MFSGSEEMKGKEKKGMKRKFIKRKFIHLVSERNT